MIGYGLSALVTALGWGLFSASSSVSGSTSSLLARTGLNFYAMHHIRIAGASADGGPAATVLSILWPLTIWAALPSIAITVGGFVSARVAGAKGSSGCRAGAWVAVPYSVILLIMRPHFWASSTSVSLPVIPVPGTEFDPGLLAARLGPALGGAIFYSLVFGGIFGAVGGAGGLSAIWRWVRGQTSWPSWARGALMALLISEVLFFLMLTALAAAREERQPTDSSKFARSWATEALAGAKFAHYLAQGVTLKGSVVPLEAGSFKIGWFTGIVQEGKEPKPVRPWLYLLAVVPAASLVYAGRSAAKMDRGSTNRFLLVACTAGSYALFQSAAVLLYTLVLRTAITTGGATMNSAVIIGPSAAQSFLFGLVFALIFTMIGVSIHKPHASS